MLSVAQFASAWSPRAWPPQGGPCVCVRATSRDAQPRRRTCAGRDQPSPLLGPPWFVDRARRPGLRRLRTYLRLQTSALRRSGCSSAHAAKPAAVIGLTLTSQSSTAVDQSVGFHDVLVAPARAVDDEVLIGVHLLRPQEPSAIAREVSSAGMILRAGQKLVRVERRRVTNARVPHTLGFVPVRVLGPDAG